MKTHFQVNAPHPIVCKGNVQVEFVRFGKRDLSPRILDIDELYLNRRYRCILTNIKAVVQSKIWSITRWLRLGCKESFSR
jgi:serine/threonine-protein kinase RIO1